MLKISNKLIVLFLFFLVVSACSSSDSSGPTLVEISSDEESEDFEEENEDEEDSDEEEDNPTVREFKRMQQKNIMCVSLLNQQGYEGNKLRATLKEQKQSTEQTLTIPHSQECVEAIMHCKTHGQSFMATGGMPITADETFLAAEQEKKKKLLKWLKVKLFLQII